MHVSSSATSDWNANWCFAVNTVEFLWMNKLSEGETYAVWSEIGLHQDPLNFSIVKVEPDSCKNKLKYFNAADFLKRKNKLG